SERPRLRSIPEPLARTRVVPLTRPFRRRGFTQTPGARLIMDWKVFATVFGTVFLAELGDKTQLATLLFASKNPGILWTIFIAASLALVLTSAIGVVAGSVVAQYVSPKY